MHGVYDIIRGIETDFISSITNGGAAAEEFADKFRIFKEQDIPSFETASLSLLYTAASSIHLISECFQEAEIEWDRGEQDFFKLFEGMSLSDNSTQKTYAKEDIKYLSTATKTRTYTQVLSEWLLANLANPYPSPSTKRTLSAQSGASLKTLTDWFAHARAKIGWTKLIKRHFGGDRARAIDAAYKALYQYPSTSTGGASTSAGSGMGMGMGMETIRAFEEIRKAAEALCGVVNVAVVEPVKGKEKEKEREESVKQEQRPSEEILEGAKRSRKRNVRPDEEEEEEERRVCAIVSSLSSSPAEGERPVKRSRSEKSVQRARKQPTRPYDRKPFRPYYLERSTSRERPESPDAYSSSEYSTGPSTPASSPAGSHDELFVEIAGSEDPRWQPSSPDLSSQNKLQLPCSPNLVKSNKRSRSEEEERQECEDTVSRSSAKRPRYDAETDSSSQQPSPLESVDDTIQSLSIPQQQLPTSSSDTQFTLDDLNYLSFDIPPPPIISTDFFADSIFEVASWADPSLLMPSFNTVTNPLALPLSHSPLLNPHPLEISATDTTASLTPSSSSLGEHTEISTTPFSEALSLTAADFALLAAFDATEAYAQTGAFLEALNEPLQMATVDGPHATQLACASGNSLMEASHPILVPVS